MKFLKLKKYKLELIVFCSGAIVMILELTGSRVLAPYLGNTTFVWSSLIGIVLGALSLGYWLGGKMADKNPNFYRLALFFIFAAVFVGVLTVTKEYIIQQLLPLGMRLASVLSSLALFAVPAFFLGLVSPYAVRLKIKAVETSGHTVGNLYAISTFGSIVGTFAAGFVLIPSFGTNKILYSLFFVLIALALLSDYKVFKFKSIVAVFAITLVFFTYDAISKSFNPECVYSAETKYQSINVCYYVNEENGKLVRVLRLDNQFSSGVMAEDGDLAFDYTKHYRLDKVFYPQIKTALLLGGGAYTVPRDFIKRNPGGIIDVVEIDDQLQEVAKEFFFFEEDDRIAIYHQDARRYLFNTQKKYDAIYIDIFSQFIAPPFHITTREMVEEIYSSLNEEGVVIYNIIGYTDRTDYFLHSQYKTYQEFFDNIYIIPVSGREHEGLQNIMLIAHKSSKTMPKSVLLALADEEQEEYLENLLDDFALDEKAILLTDDFAPVYNFNLKHYN